MSQTCPKCGRIRHDAPPDVVRIYGASADVDMCPGEDWVSCILARRSHARGLRDGLEIAKEHHIVRDVYIHDDGQTVCDDPYVDWTDADAELERRMRRGETFIAFNSVTCAFSWCCWQCAEDDGVRITGMQLCAKCGNKRCPHATDHRHECTGSNEPGQPGSVYGDYEVRKRDA